MRPSPRRSWLNPGGCRRRRVTAAPVRWVLAGLFCVMATPGAGSPPEASLLDIIDQLEQLGDVPFPSARDELMGQLRAGLDRLLAERAATQARHAQLATGGVPEMGRSAAGGTPAHTGAHAVLHDAGLAQEGSTTNMPRGDSDGNAPSLPIGLLARLMRALDTGPSLPKPAEPAVYSGKAAALKDWILDVQMYFWAYPTMPEHEKALLLAKWLDGPARSAFRDMVRANGGMVLTVEAVMHMLKQRFGSVTEQWDAWSLLREASQGDKSATWWEHRLLRILGMAGMEHVAKDTQIDR